VRYPEHCANAGFSTKFCESLASGTPIIANLTSDMGHYLRNGVEGLVCSDHSVEELAETLRTALRMGPTQRDLMRRAARECALRSFDFRAYSGVLGTFLDEVCASRHPLDPTSTHQSRVIDLAPAPRPGCASQ
jgi:glycosyltransferase involved in cell wall biosynthesis